MSALWEKIVHFHFLLYSILNSSPPGGPTLASTGTLSPDNYPDLA